SRDWSSDVCSSDLQCLGHQQVGVGVEAAGKLLALIAQIAFDLKLHAVEIVIELLALQTAPEFGAHGVVREVGDMPDHARQHQPADRKSVVLLEVPAVKLGVRENGLSRDFVESDVLCG